MTLAAQTALRTAIIAALKADAGVQAAMGAVPRVVNRAPPGLPFPFIVVSSQFQPWDTTTDRGGQHDVEFRLMGEYEGDKQGETIFRATQEALRDWAPRALTDHWLVNLELRFEDVRSEEDGKRYFGMQRWRAVTEEAASIFVPPSPPAAPSLQVEEEERQTRLAAVTLSALRLVKVGADGRLSYADHSVVADGWALLGVAENAGNVGDPINVRMLLVFFLCDFVAYYMKVHCIYIFLLLILLQ